MHIGLIAGIRSAGLQRLGCCLWLAATSMLLQSCAPDPPTERALADKFFNQVAHEISPVLYARLGSPWTAKGRNQSVALVFLEGGVPPPTATCAADLRADLERQLDTLAVRARIRLRMTSNEEGADVLVLIGDTIRDETIRGSPLPTLMSAARQRTGVATSEFSRNFGIPGHSSPDFLNGLFANSNDRLVFGVSMIHWMVTRRGDKAKDCAFNFVARFAELYSLALTNGFRSEYSDAWRAARQRTGLSAYEVPNPMVEFHLGVYFCAQFVDPAELAECSSQVHKLIDNPR